MNEAARMKRDPTGQKRQTASGYAAEIRPWGRYSEEQIQEAVAYALARGTILPDESEAAEGAANVAMMEESEMPDQKEQLIQEVVLRLFDLAGIQGLDRVTSLNALVTQIEQEVRADRRREYD